MIRVWDPADLGKALRQLSREFSSEVRPSLKRHLFARTQSQVRKVKHFREVAHQRQAAARRKQRRERAWPP